jgi:hypothetical protein
MKYFQRKEFFPRSFSYIDVFFILLAVLALSFGIYYIAERSDRNENVRHEIELSAVVVKELKASIPEAGDFLLDGEKKIGEILSVEIREGAEVFQVKLLCQRKGRPPKIGEEIKLETYAGICVMQVESVEEIKSEKGR